MKLGTGTEVGYRIGALLSIDREAKVINLLGFGVYEGRFAPPGSGWPEGHLNPRMKLDNGEIVWGFQCWWLAEGELQEMIAKLEKDGFTVEQVSLNHKKNPELVS